MQTLLYKVELDIKFRWLLWYLLLLSLLQIIFMIIRKLVQISE